MFTVLPEARHFKWTGQNDLFALTNEHIFAMGGGGDGFALQLDDELDTGMEEIYYPSTHT